METELPTYDRTFNKDIAFLYELQRLESMANNFAIEGSSAERLRTLKRWAGALKGILKEEENNLIEELFLICKPAKDALTGKIFYPVDVIDKLHDYLNTMNTSHNLQLTKRSSGAEAAKLV